MGRISSRRAAPTFPLVLAGACLLLVAGCEKAVRNMYDQPDYRPLVESALWPDGQSARPLEAGVVVHSAGALSASSSGRQAEIALPDWADGASSRNPAGTPGSSAAAGPAVMQLPPAPTIESLQRGRQRYDIYCAPCHSVSGDGDGMVVRRGFPAPGSLYSPSLRAASDAQLFDVITSGTGVMYGFSDRIAPKDRWAIVAYLRALQRSQHAAIDDVPMAERHTLLGEKP